MISPPGFVGDGKMHGLFLLIVFMAFPFAGISKTIFVPDDHAEIQEAIIAASHGDTIIVRPGTYVENLNFLGKDITVASEQGAEVTVIDGNRSGSVVTFDSGEGRTTVLEGFTIVNGTGTLGIYSLLMGGGIYCLDHSSPSLVHNIIRSNHVADWGGGICCMDHSKPAVLYNDIHGNSADTGGAIYCRNLSSALIKYNEVHDNVGFGGGGGVAFTDYSNAEMLYNRIQGNTTKNSSSKGAGIFSHDSSPLISGNVIAGNKAFYDGAGIACRFGAPTVVNNTLSCNRSGNYGGGLYLYWTDAIITNNTVCGNFAREGGSGLYCGEGSDALVTNTILWDNCKFDQIVVEGLKWGCTLTMSYSNVQGGSASVYVGYAAKLNWGDGMIDALPRFVDLPMRDFHLFHDSPCRDAGDNAAPGLPGQDHEEDPRIAHGAVDMGADEFYTHLYATSMEAFSVIPHRKTQPEGGLHTVCKLVGSPGSSPTLLFLGSGFADPPKPTPWGNFHLNDPWILVPLPSMPANGVLEWPVALPASIPIPYPLYMQGMIGLNPESLTNRFFLEVQ
jgi:nitrous oxidase accessory protein NosD